MPSYTRYLMPIDQKLQDDIITVYQASELVKETIEKFNYAGEYGCVEPDLGRV